MQDFSPGDLLKSAEGDSCLARFFCGLLIARKRLELSDLYDVKKSSRHAPDGRKLTVWLDKKFSDIPTSTLYRIEREALKILQSFCDQGVEAGEWPQDLAAALDLPETPGDGGAFCIVGLFRESFCCESLRGLENLLAAKRRDRKPQQRKKKFAGFTKLERFADDLEATIGQVAVEDKVKLAAWLQRINAAAAGALNGSMPALAAPPAADEFTENLNIADEENTGLPAHYNNRINNDDIIGGKKSEKLSYQDAVNCISDMARFGGAESKARKMTAADEAALAKLLADGFTNRLAWTVIREYYSIPESKGLNKDFKFLNRRCRTVKQFINNLQDQLSFAMRASEKEGLEEYFEESRNLAKAGEKEAKAAKQKAVADPGAMPEGFRAWFDSQGFRDAEGNARKAEDGWRMDGLRADWRASLK